MENRESFRGVKLLIVTLIVVFLVGCVQVQVVKKNKFVTPAYPDPRSDSRFFPIGAYPYPIAY